MTNKYTALIFTLIGITSAHAMHDIHEIYMLKEQRRRTVAHQQELRSRGYRAYNAKYAHIPKVNPQETPDLKNSLNSDRITDERQLPNT
jgi:hypothetical protein